MTNHELCLLAAKAAGYTIESDHAGSIKRTNAHGLTDYWNPLEDDRDAFRLMVDCQIIVEILESQTETYICWGDGHHFEPVEPHGTDKHAATRRAIVRAAAAMGESAPKSTEELKNELASAHLELIKMTIDNCRQPCSDRPESQDQGQRHD